MLNSLLFDRIQQILPRRLLGNAGAFTVASISTRLVPLLVLPFVLRALGAEQYGNVVFAQSIILLLGIVVNYGFDISGPRQLVEVRDDHALFNFRALHIWYCRLLLAVPLMLGCYAALTVFSFPREIEISVWVLSLALLSDALLPRWLYIATERMYAVSAVELAANIVYAVSVVILLDSPDDFLLFAILLAARPLMAALALLPYSFIRNSLSVVALRPRQILEAMKDGRTIFVTLAVSSLFTMANPVILGVAASTREVGYYVPAERLIRGAGELIRPLIVTAYPTAHRLVLKDDLAGLGHLICVLLLANVVIGSGLCFVFFVFAGPIIQIIFGEDAGISASVLRIVSFVPFVAATGVILVRLIYIPARMDGARFVILLIGALINCLLGYVLASQAGAIGMAVGLLAAETTIAILSLGYVMRTRFRPFFR